MPDSLTDKQRDFCQQYVVDSNATQAAIRAGYSSHTAKQQGSRLLTKVNVQQEIQRKQAEKTRETQHTAAEVEQELWAVLTAARVSDDLTVWLRAGEALGRVYGLFAEDNRQKGTTARQITIIMPEQQSKQIEGVVLDSTEHVIGNNLLPEHKTSEDNDL